MQQEPSLLYAIRCRQSSKRNFSPCWLRLPTRVLVRGRGLTLSTWWHLVALPGVVRSGWLPFLQSLKAFWSCLFEPLLIWRLVIGCRVSFSNIRVRKSSWGCLQTGAPAIPSLLYERLLVQAEEWGWGSSSSSSKCTSSSAGSSQSRPCSVQPLLLAPAGGGLGLSAFYF